jgi:transposase
MAAASPHPLMPDPMCLTLDSIAVRAGVIIFSVRTRAATATCPLCGHAAERVHSRYPRTLLDLPWQGNAVRIELTCRKFFCDNRDCQRRIFAEPIPTVAARYARKTERLAGVLRELTYLVGGEAAAKIARAVGLMVSPDTLLASLRNAASVLLATPRVLGVDDFALRRGQCYGTLLVDLERHRPIDLLPDRESPTLAAWLREHPGVEIVSRDRAGCYAEGAAQGAPSALQVADRWHLLRNVVEALEVIVGREMPTAREVARSLLPPLPDTGAAPMSKYEQQKTERRARRLARFERLRELLDSDSPPMQRKEQGAAAGISETTLYRWRRLTTFPERKPLPRRDRLIDPFVPYLQRRWNEGCHNGAQLFRELTQQGFTGTSSPVSDFLHTWHRQRRQHRARERPPMPSQRQLTWLLVRSAPPAHPAPPDASGNPLDPPTRAFAELVEALCERSPVVRQARELTQGFFTLVRQKNPDALSAWLESARHSGLSEMVTFGKGLEKDRAAVLAGIAGAWSNGQVEGQVNRLKLVKRSMYGRASFDLLRARVLPPPELPKVM